ncbi:MAG: hypothetical protein IPM75_01220 [Candidatus Competibacteraceae bacterium]|nr:hypothetical protein [Candidatus Competibacteraceae bacterium]
MAINLRIANSNDASEIATLTQELGYGVSEKETLEWFPLLGPHRIGADMAVWADVVEQRYH